MFIKVTGRVSGNDIYVNVNNISSISKKYGYVVIQSNFSMSEVKETMEEVMEKINEVTQGNQVLEKLEEINDNINEGIGEVINTINPR